MPPLFPLRARQARSLPPLSSCHGWVGGAQRLPLAKGTRWAAFSSRAFIRIQGEAPRRGKAGVQHLPSVLRAHQGGGEKQQRAPAPPPRTPKSAPRCRPRVLHPARGELVPPSPPQHHPHHLPSLERTGLKNKTLWGGRGGKQGRVPARGVPPPASSRPSRRRRAQRRCCLPRSYSCHTH